MAMYDKNKTYKNPKIPKYGQSAAAGQKQAVAPAREGGMLQMAAAARAKQPKAGAPPIPATKAFSAAQKPSGGVAPRQQAAQALGASMGMGGVQAGTGAAAPAGLLQEPVGTETDTQAMGSGGAFPLPQEDTTAPPTGLETEGLPGTGTEALPDVGETPQDLSVQPTGPGDEDGEGLAGFKEALEKKKQEAFKGALEKKKQGAESMQQGVEEGSMIPAYDEGGGQSGYYDKNGNFYDNTGNQQAAPPEGTLDPSSSALQGQKQQMTSEVTNYLTQATGIPEEEINKQMGQIMMASSAELANFAQMMAAHGTGSGGLFASGMGQIASQALGAMTNLRFENAKLGVEERMNKMKAFMSLQGQMMSEENRMKIFDEMSSLEREKFKYEQDQNEFADQWTVFNNMAALAQVYEDDAFQYAFKNMTEDVVDSDGDGKPDRPLTASEIFEQLETVTDPKTGIVTLKLKLKEGEGGEQSTLTDEKLFEEEGGQYSSKAMEYFLNESVMEEINGMKEHEQTKLIKDMLKKFGYEGTDTQALEIKSAIEQKYKALGKETTADTQEGFF